MWTDELRAVRSHFQEVGSGYRDEMYVAWQERRAPLPVWEGLAAEGYFSALTNQGLGFRPGIAWYAAASEGFTYGTRDPGFNIGLVCHGVMAMPVVDRWGHAELKAKYLDGMRSAEIVAAFAVTEKGGGTDAYHPASTITRAGTEWVLNGSKWHISNTPHARVALVWVRREDTGHLAAVLIDLDWDGVTRSNPLRPAGARTSPVASMSFEDVRIPADHLVVAEHGRARLTEALIGERLVAGFVVTGLLDSIIEQVLTFAGTRKVFDRRVSHFQYVQGRITDIKMDVEQLRALCETTMRRFLDGEDVRLQASVIKVTAQNAVMKAATNAMLVCGSYGLQDESQLSSALLDGVTGAVGGGTEEAHRIIIFNEMVKSHAASLRDGSLAMPDWMPWSDDS
jgi:alkylation response protein AidB-like acyl-CoA dehydrogenase